MQWLSVATALAALGFFLSLFRSRRGAYGYGNVLAVMPLALATPLVALMFSGLVLIDGFRRAGGEEGRDALVAAVVTAARTQLIGHVALVGSCTVLAVMLIVLWLRPSRSDAGPSDHPPNEPKLSPRTAMPLLAMAVLVCIAGVAALTEFEERFVTSPLAFVVAFESSDFSELASNRRVVDDQRRRISNTIVVETFRALVVVVLFLVMFDAFLVGSRGIRFTKWALLVSAVLLGLGAAVSVRGMYRQWELQRGVQEGLKAVAEAEAEAEEDEAEEMPAPEQAPR